MPARTRVAIRATREPLCAPVIGRTDGRPAHRVPTTASRPGGRGAASVVLTRVAETLRRHELEHRVRVVLFDLEEAGLLGSRAYVQDEDGDRIAAMVNADVVAGDGTLMYGPTSHEGNEAVYRSLLVVCADSEVPCMAFPRYPSSDDRTFQAAGIPNVSIAAPNAGHKAGAPGSCGGPLHGTGR